MQFGIFDEPRRKPIKVSVKREVYKRAKGRCESCGIKLAMSEGDFHHTRAPSISPTAKSVQFLCPTCHRKYGHKRKTVTHRGFFEDEKETIIKRKKAPTRKRTTKKKSAKRKTTKKKKLTKKKTTTKRKILKGKTTKKKTTTHKKRTTKKRPAKRKKMTARRKTKRKKK